MTPRYRVIHDAHGSRILRDNEPISLEQVVTELHALERENNGLTQTLNALYRGLRALVKQAESGGMV